MDYEFRPGDLAVVSNKKGIAKEFRGLMCRSIIERYRGLTCRVVDAADFDGYVRIVFDEDPNGEPGRIYTASTEALIRLCCDESDSEVISEFLDEM